MSWITPILTWVTSKVPTTDDFSRIEGNTDYLKDFVDDLDTNLSAEASARAAADTALSNRADVLEGSGSIQGVGTGDSPTFAGGTFNGRILPSSTSYSVSRSTTGATLIPRGLYQAYFVFTGGGSGVEASVQAYINSTWVDVVSITVSGTSDSFFVASNGSNVRIYSASLTGSSPVMTFYANRY
jgi:hypothetical protein